jgi:hypothetical protein
MSTKRNSVVLDLFPFFSYKDRNDSCSLQFETERNNVATAVTCYMKEYKTTKDQASEALWDIELKTHGRV